MFRLCNDTDPSPTGHMPTPSPINATMTVWSINDHVSRLFSNSSAIRSFRLVPVRTAFATYLLETRETSPGVCLVSWKKYGINVQYLQRSASYMAREFMYLAETGLLRTVLSVKILSCSVVRRNANVANKIYRSTRTSPTTL